MNNTAPMTNPVEDIASAIYRYADSIAPVFGTETPPWPVTLAYKTAEKYLAWPSGEPSFTEYPTLRSDVKAAYALTKLRVAAKHLAYLNSLILNADENQIDETVKKWKGKAFNKCLTSTNPRKGRQIASEFFYNGL